MKHLVITVHGIRTFGDWQERLEQLLNDEVNAAGGESLEVLNYKYGYFSVIAFLIPVIRWLVVRRFRFEFLRRSKSAEWDRIDIIAHSFGTHLVGWGLHGIPKNERLRVHTIILAGSVLKPSFPWLDLTDSCLRRLVNDCGIYDRVLVLNQLVVLFTGMAGRVGFAGMTGNNFRNRFFAFGHSGYFVGSTGPDDSFMKAKWVPLLVQDSLIAVFPDPRHSSAVSGLVAFFLNNIEPIKLTVYLLPVVALFLFYHSLYITAAAERDRATSALSQSDFLESLRSINENRDFDALAQLARSLSFNRENRAALTRLVTFLTYRDYTTPLLRLELDADVHSAQFSPDGKRILTEGSDVVRVWDAETGKPLTGPMKDDEDVTSAEFSHDGKRIVTTWGDPNGPGYARVWDAETGIHLTEPIPHKKRVASADFSWDGKRIVTAWGGYARVWNAETGKPLTRPMQHDTEIQSAEFSPDGALIVTASGHREDVGYAQVWDAKSGKPVTASIKHDGCVDSAKFSPDGKRIVTACDNYIARVWDAITGKPLTEPMKHPESGSEQPHMSAQFSPDGKWIVTGSHDGTVRVWDAETGKLLTDLTPDAGDPVEFSPDGKRILATDGQVWDAETGRPLTGPIKDINSARFSADGRRIVTASSDGKTVRIWDGKVSRPLAQTMKHNSDATSAQFSPDGKRMVTAAEDGRALVWDVETAKQVAETMQLPEKITSVQFSPDGKRIVTASGLLKPGEVRVWNSETGEPVTEAIAHEMEVRWVEFSRDGKRIVTAFGDRDASPEPARVPGYARVWDAQTGKPLTEPMKHDMEVQSVHFSPDSKRIVTASTFHRSSGEARVWDAETGKPLTEPMKHDAGVNSAEFSYDGKRVVTASDNGARVWNAETGKLLTGPIDTWADDAHFSPDGKQLVTTPGNGARVWDAETGKPLTELIGNEAGLAVEGAQFSPDGKRIVTASSRFHGYKGHDQGVRIWDAETGKPLTDPLPGGDPVQFSPDGKRILVVGGEVWDIAPAGTAWPAWLPRLADALAGQHLSNRGVFEPLSKDSVELIREIREEISHEPVDNDWAILGRWFLADRSTRTISPFSKVTVPEYIEKRINENTPESLDEAERLALGNVDLLKRVARARETSPRRPKQGVPGDE